MFSATSFAPSLFSDIVRAAKDAGYEFARFDARRLHLLILQHARYTGSRRAVHILENWEAYLPKFRKVMPVEYRRALAELAKDKAAAMQAAE